MFTIYFQKSYKLFAIFASVFMLNSCLIGPQPDKEINVVLEAKNGMLSKQEMGEVIQKLTNRLQKVASKSKVFRIENSNQIRIEVATHYDAKRIKEYMLNPGKLDFYEVYIEDKMASFIEKANEMARTETETEEETNPLFDLIKEDGYKGGPILFSVLEKDTATVKKYLRSESAMASLPVGRKFIKFLWGVKQMNTDHLPLYAVKLENNGKPALSGDVVKDSFQNYDVMGNPVVGMQMNEVGARMWERLTGKAFKNRSYIAIVLNNKVYSAPGVSSGPITGGRSEISGDFTQEQAHDFAIILNSGAIPEMNVISFEVKTLK